MKRIAVVLALMASATLACSNREESGAVGTSGTTPAVAPTPAVSSGDRDFVNDLAIANMAEVDLGKLADRQSSNANVKTFAKMMVDDHTGAQERLNSIASIHAIPMPTSIDEKHRDLYDKLSKLQGAAFDREYMSAMTDGHADVLDKLESRIDKISLKPWKDRLLDTIKGKTDPNPPPVVAEMSDDPTTMALNQWAAEAYPVVYHHHVSAQTIDKSVTHRTSTQ